MFAPRYFAPRYFAPRYWTPGSDAVVVTPTAPPTSVPAQGGFGGVPLHAATDRRRLEQEAARAEFQAERETIAAEIRKEVGEAKAAEILEIPDVSREVAAVRGLVARLERIDREIDKINAQMRDDDEVLFLLMVA